MITADLVFCLDSELCIKECNLLTWTKTLGFADSDGTSLVPLNNLVLGAKLVSFVVVEQQEKLTQLLETELAAKKHIVKECEVGLVNESKASAGVFKLKFTISKDQVRLGTLITSDDCWSHHETRILRGKET